MNWELALFSVEIMHLQIWRIKIRHNCQIEFGSLLRLIYLKIKLKFEFKINESFLGLIKFTNSHVFVLVMHSN